MNVNIEYLDANVKKYYAEFKVEGKYKDSYISEKISVSYKEMEFKKLTKIKIDSSLNFLRAVNEIKNKLADKKVNKILAEIAHEKHIMHKEEMEELTLMLDLVKVKKKPNNKFPVYNEKGVISYLAW